MTGADVRAAATAAWTEFRDAYLEYQERNPGWKAFWTAHHAFAFDAALREFILAMGLEVDLDD